MAPIGELVPQSHRFDIHPDGVEFIGRVAGAGGTADLVDIEEISLAASHRDIFRLIFGNRHGEDGGFWLDIRDSDLEMG